METYVVILDPTKDRLGKPLPQFVCDSHELSGMLVLFELTAHTVRMENPCKNFTWSNMTLGWADSLFILPWQSDGLRCLVV